MKKLTVNVEARVDESFNVALGVILTTWNKLAQLLDEQVVLPNGCDLAWDLSLIKNDKRKWTAYSIARVVYSAYTHWDQHGHYVDIPVIEVEEIMINDNGTFFWHDKAGKLEENTDDLQRLVTALSKGRQSGHNFVKSDVLFQALKC